MPLELPAALGVVSGRLLPVLGLLYPFLGWSEPCDACCRPWVGAVPCGGSLNCSESRLHAVACSDSGAYAEACSV